MTGYLARPVIQDIYRCLLGSRNDNCVEKISDVYRHLRSRNRNNFKDLNIRSEQDLAAVLALHPSFFSCSISERFGNRYVSPTTELSICTSYSKKSTLCAGVCQSLHMCKFYLLSGQCPYGDQCMFGHSLDQNRRILQSYHLDSFSLTELRRLLCLPWVRRGVAVPRVCRYYNKHSGCAKPQTCYSLHLCGPYLDKNCKFGKFCKRNHHIDDKQVSSVLTWYGVGVKGRRITSILDEVRSFPDDDDDRYDDSYDSSDAEETPPSGSGTPQNNSRSRSLSAVRGFPVNHTQQEPTQRERQQTDRRSRIYDLSSVQDRTTCTRPRSASLCFRPCTSIDPAPFFSGDANIFAQSSSSQASVKFSADSSIANKNVSARLLTPREPIDGSTNAQFGIATSLHQTRAKEYSRYADASSKRGVLETREQRPISSVKSPLNKTLTPSLMSDQSPISATCRKTPADASVRDVKGSPLPPHIYSDNPAFLALSTAPPLQPDSFVRHETADNYEGTRNGKLGATRQVSCPAETQPSQRQPISRIPSRQALTKRLGRMYLQLAELNGYNDIDSQLQSVTQRMCLISFQLNNNSQSQLQSLEQQMDELQLQVQMLQNELETTPCLSVINRSVEGSIEPRYH